MDKIELVFATRNFNKLKEIRTIFKDSMFKILSLDNFPEIPSWHEDGESFAENAIKKATIVAKYTGKYTIADDSGLEVEALNGRPGIYSARYAGKNSDDKANNNKLIKELKGIPQNKRDAMFRCVIVVASPDCKYCLAEGTCKGNIIDIPRGKNGFGYDPIFFIPDIKRTMAELSLSEKNKISHRALAIKELKKILPEFLKKTL
ncbi:MAG: XTP/dITP diphosphatase [Thermodesulfobacteriota bacterium]|nr:XTP/dITP diphosphatase [Thermodesulfobacteriota bacterium]